MDQHTPARPVKLPVFPHWPGLLLGALAGGGAYAALWQKQLSLEAPWDELLAPAGLIGQAVGLFVLVSLAGEWFRCRARRRRDAAPDIPAADALLKAWASHPDYSQHTTAERSKFLAGVIAEREKDLTARWRIYFFASLAPLLGLLAERMGALKLGAYELPKEWSYETPLSIGSLETAVLVLIAWWVRGSWSRLLRDWGNAWRSTEDLLSGKAAPLPAAPAEESEPARTDAGNGFVQPAVQAPEPVRQQEPPIRVPPSPQKRDDEPWVYE